MRRSTEIVQSDEARRGQILANNDSSVVDDQNQLRQLYIMERHYRSELHQLRRRRKELEYRNLLGRTQINVCGDSVEQKQNASLVTSKALIDSSMALPEKLTETPDFPTGSSTSEQLQALRKCVKQEETLFDMLVQERDRRKNTMKLQPKSIPKLSPAPGITAATTPMMRTEPSYAVGREDCWTGSIPVAMDVDKYVVSLYQQILRESLEFFVLDKPEILSNAHGRGGVLQKGQVGIRCRFCKCRPFHLRGRGSVYFPGKVLGIYQAAQNIGTNHLLTTCKEIPADRRERMSASRQTLVRRNGGGKKYWEECCRSVGIYDRMDMPGLWLTASDQGMRPQGDKQGQQRSTDVV